MKVILQKDVKDLGKAGDIVNVSQGFARNYLFPRRMALVATEGKMAEWEHLKRVAEQKKRKAQQERQKVIEKINGMTVSFKVQAGENEKIFGSITNHDISEELENQGVSIDKRDIHLEEPIKMLGQHKATVKLGDGLVAELSVLVERQA